MIKSVTHKKQALDMDDILGDEELPGMKLLLDARAIGRLLQDHWRFAGMILVNCEVEYIRHKPTTNCLATYRVKFARTKESDPEEAVIWGKAYLGDDFRIAANKARSRVKRMSAILDEALVIEESRLIVDDIANDPQLDGLQTILDPRKLRRVIYEFVPAYPESEWRISHKRLTASIVRFKPEKRAVVRIATTATHLETSEKRDLVLYLRCYCDDRGAAIFAVMRALADGFSQSDRVMIPAPYAYRAENKILIVAGVQGRPMLDCLESDGQDVILVRVAEALGELHKSTSAAPATRDHADLLEDARAATAALKTALPDYAALVDGLLKSIAGGLRDNSERLGFVHGDFHHGQILIQSAREVLLDFDRSYRGDTLADIGNFCAHLRILETENRLKNSVQATNIFVAGYERASGRPIDRTELRHWVALGLLLRAIHPFRTLQPDWRGQIISILDLCQECLA